MNLQILRRETEACHRAVENCIPLMHAELDTAQYVRCLRQMYGIVAAWEERAADAAPAWMQSTLAERQRKRLLELDLAWFGVAEQDDRRPMLPEMNALPRLLGTMYVMEGSTLGGQLIARHLETTLHLRDGKGNAYFRGHGIQTGPMWKEFCEMLKQRVSDDQTDTVVASAKAMFTTFGEWMSGKSVMNESYSSGGRHHLLHPCKRDCDCDNPKL
ncbi:MAG: biliverdin-producing heme oxygenase [Ktedonobacteraceae bacterium]|nr:biliverdin-producing heme oxygenase [Ktedonobacteraceae bacterium]